MAENGFGKYRITGKIKTSSETAQKITMHLTKDYKGANTKGTDEKTYYSANVYSKYIENVASSWVPFSFDIDVSDYGVGQENVTLQAFPNAHARDCSIDFYSENNSSAEAADLYIADIKVEYIEEYANPGKAPVIISNESGVIYANEIAIDEEYNFNTALQLKEGDDVTGLNATIAHPTADKTQNANITITSNLDNITATKTTKTVNVSFNIFDFVDVRNITSLTMLAVNYKNGLLTGSTVVPLNIKEDTLVNQNIVVANDADETKLFLIENMATLIPLAGKHVTTSYSSKTPKLFLVGDSICVGYPNENQYPQQGWGKVMADLNLLENIEVVNCAHGGFSTATFLDYATYRRGYPNAHTWNGDSLVISDGRSMAATKILPQISKGDYVIVSLGINDNSSSECGTTEAEYKANLQKFIDDTRNKGAEIIFVTPTVNGTATSGNYYDDGWQAYAGYMKAIAAANNVVLLDLGTEMAEQYAALDTDTVQSYHMFKSSYENVLKVDAADHTNTSVQNGTNDTTHLSEAGAEFVAKLIIDLLEESDSSLKYFVKGE